MKDMENINKSGKLCFEILNPYKRRKVACLTAYYQSLLTLNLIL